MELQPVYYDVNSARPGISSPSHSLGIGHGVHQVPQKRARLAKSCTICRNKKLKCDRLVPCHQCSKSGRAPLCNYDHEDQIAPQARVTEDLSLESGQRRRKIPSPTGFAAGLPAIVPPNPTLVHNDYTGVIENLQTRVDKLEKLLSSHLEVSAESSRQFSLGSKPGAGSLTNVGTLNVKGLRSRFHGLCQKLTLLNEFDEARTFIRGSFEEPSIIMMARECQSLQKDAIEKHMASERYSSLDDSSTLSGMLRMVSQRNVCDRLVRIYVDNFENALRILHIPTFLTECENFWTSQKDNTRAFTDFIPQLCITMVIASSLDGPTTVESEMPEKEFRASEACDMVRRWMDGLKGKHRIKLSTLRTQTLLVLAHQTRHKRAEEIWSETGALVRSAMTMGLHRDPTEFPDLTRFEQEQRRRLWITIAEIDLQVSITCGMPSMIRGADFEWSVPANVNDKDLFEDMALPPMQQSSDEWTDSSCQVALANSLPLRLDAMGSVSNIRVEMDCEEPLKHARKIEEYLRDLPAILKPDSTTDQTNDGSGRLFGRTLLDVYLRRIFLHIYRRLAWLGSAEARTACVRSSLIILSHQDTFDPDVADLDVINSKQYWDLFYTFCKVDIVQAALSVCSEIKAMTHISSSPSNRMTSGKDNGRPHNQVMPAISLGNTSAWTKASLTRIVENAVDGLVRRAGKIGSDLKDPVCISIVLQSVRTNGSAVRKEVLMREGLNTVVNGYSQTLKDEVNTGYSASKAKDNGLRPSNSLTAENGSRGNGGSSPVTLSHRQGYSVQDNAATQSINGFLPTGEIDFEAVDFGFGADWDLDHAWL